MGLPKRMLALGLDIGGSSIKSVLVEQSSPIPSVVHEGLQKVNHSREPHQVIEDLMAIVASYRAHHGHLESIGVGIPGTIDGVQGLSLVLPNFPSEWRGFPIRHRLESVLGQKISIVNDANAFGIAESALGAGVGLTTVVYVVLGTGVGGSIVHEGRIFHGGGTAGEIGHITVEMNGPLCGCGNRGCVEAFAGSDAIARLGKRTTAKEVFEDASAGDAHAQAVIDSAAKALAVALANVYITLAPDAFVIGGGVVESGPEFVGRVEREARQRVFVAREEKIRLLQGRLGRHAGAIGAALASFGYPD